MGEAARVVEVDGDPSGELPGDDHVLVREDGRVSGPDQAEDADRLAAHGDRHDDRGVHTEGPVGGDPFG